MALTKITSNVIATNAISGTLIADNAITAVHIAQNAITQTQIAAGALSDALAANSITAAMIPNATNLTLGTVTAALTGNVAGNVTGTAGSATGNAATATALANARTIGGTSFDGTANIAVATATLATTTTVSDSTANTNFPVVFHNESNGLLDDTGALRYNPSTGELLAPKLTVAGTTTTVDTVTMQAANAIIFEGATADNYETTLSIVDPTADHTQYLINQGGYIPVLAAATTTAITSTPAELNILDGVTSSAAELNLLDGVSGLVQADLTKLAAIDATAAEIDLLDGLDRGSILYGNASSATTVLGQGSADQVLTSDGTDISWEDAGGSGATLSGSTNNHVTTVTGANAIQGESSLTFNGSELSIDGYINVSGNGGGAIFNDSGADVDFRVESNNVANMLFVDGGNDRVGIGTASPATALHVYSNDGIEQGLTITQNTDDANSGALIRLYNSSATAAMIRFGANHSSKANELFITNVGTNSPMTFATQDTERMRITSAGNVGIGTTSPGYNLVVNSTGNSVLQIKAGDTSWSSIYFGEQSNAYRGIIQYNHASDYMDFYTSAAQRMRIDSSGNVGIGTTAPYRDLDVMNAATGETWIRFGSDYSNGQTVGLEFAAGGNGPTGSGFVQSSIYLVGSGSSSSQVLNFKLVDNSSIKLWLNSSGFNGTHASTSDIALKENIADLSDGTTLIKALRPRTFDWKEDMEHAGIGTGQTGFIAQEVEAVSDKLVTGLEGTKGIYTMGLLTLAIKAIQELEARIATLEE